MTVVHEAEDQSRSLHAVPAAAEWPPLPASHWPSWPGPACLRIHEAPDGRWLRLRLTGELDLGSAPALGDRLAQLRAQKRPVRLDLSELRFIDSSGIHLLLGAFRDAGEDGWHLGIDSVLSAPVRRVFQLAGLDRLALGSRYGWPDARAGSPAVTGNHA